MKLAVDILKNILLPKLEKDSNFDSNKINTSFWETFTTALLDFESDAKPVFATIYSLELENAEKIISKLPVIYSDFIKELAENYVLGTTSEATDILLQSKNATFETEAHYFRNLEKAIKKVERKRIKTELPTSYEKLSFELTETAIDFAIKKKEREALKEKMKVWDEELVEDTVTVQAINSKKETKVISLSWIKYAVAACVVLTTGVLYFKLSTNTIENSIQPTEDKVVTTEVPKIETEDLADVITVPTSYKVLEDVGFGFAATPKKISVIENHQEQRMVSIQKAIANNQMILGKELVAQKSVSGSKAKELESRISSLQYELNKMNEKEKQYIFDGQKLTLFISTPSKENRVLLYEDNYYLMKEKNFYRLSISKQPQFYKKETDSNVLKALDKIIFDNAE